MNALRPLRSVLYMPAANERALEKAKTIPADGLIFDLEDAVAPDAKQQARSNAVAAAKSGQYGRRIVTIRANGLDTPWGDDDITAIAASGADAIVIPKVDNVTILDIISQKLVNEGAPATMKIWPMIETPTAVFDVRHIAAHDRVEVLVIGTNDLVKELRCGQARDRAPLVAHLARTILGAREAGVAIVDGVYNDVRDAAGFLSEAEQGKQLGFDGKTLVHPSQVEPANHVWAPSDDEVDYARRVIEAFEHADASGVITVDGHMIENLHVDNARQVLATAAAIAELDR